MKHKLKMFLRTAYARVLFHTGLHADAHTATARELRDEAVVFVVRMRGDVEDRRVSREPPEREPETDSASVRELRFMLSIRRCSQRDDGRPVDQNVGRHRLGRGDNCATTDNCSTHIDSLSG